MPGKRGGRPPTLAFFRLRWPSSVFCHSFVFSVILPSSACLIPSSLHHSGLLQTSPGRFCRACRLPSRSHRKRRLHGCPSYLFLLLLAPPQNAICSCLLFEQRFGPIASLASPRRGLGVLCKRAARLLERREMVATLTSFSVTSFLEVVCTRVCLQVHAEGGRQGGGSSGLGASIVGI